MVNWPRITIVDLRNGSKAYQEHERRDAMYRVSELVLRKWWGRLDVMTDALTVLLLTWNQGFYRYGEFDQSKLKDWLENNLGSIRALHSRNIDSLNPRDEPLIRKLFGQLLPVLQIARGKNSGTKSPVAVVKTLHMLAPNFFPLWDDKIAKRYGCPYSKDAVEAYLRFCNIIRDEAVKLMPLVPPSPRTLLKQIDEFNYAKFTKNWV